MSYKVINISNPGTPTKFGGDDLDLIALTLNGQVAGLPPVKLMNQNKVTVGDNILQLLNPAETYVMRIRTPAFDHDIDVYFPDTDDNILTLLSADATNTFEVEQTYESFQLLKRISEPSNPPAGYLVFWADSGGTTKVKDENGDIMTIMASVAGAVNVGGAIGTYYGMTSNTLQFKSIQSSDLSIIIDNTTDTQIIDFSLDLSQVDLQDLGGTLANSQLAQITDTSKLHSAIVYANANKTITARHTHNNGIGIGNISDPGTAPTNSILLWSEDSLKFNDDQGTTFLTGGEEPTSKGTLWKSDANGVMRAFEIGSPGEVIKVNDTGDDLEYGLGGGTGAGIPTPGTLTQGKWGKISPESGYGMLAAYFHSITGGSGTFSPYRSSTEHGVEVFCPDQNDGGGLSGSFRNIYRELGFTLTVRFQCIRNGSDSHNLWIGLTSDLTVGNMDVSTFCNNQQCFFFGKETDDTQWTTLHNDGGTDTTKSNGISQDENIHKVVLTGSATNMTRKLDAGSTYTYTTEIPTTTQPLAILIWINAESATDKYLRILDVDLEYNFKSGA